MSDTPEFLAASTPLARGATLIEASAGTGKTYTIAGIFLRLVVEENVGVGEILVTTYTVPATAELRDRIRRLLRRALDGASDDPLIAAVLGRVPPDVARRRLEAALRAFDEAAIHTIHGFCQRVLQDRAFESRVLFDAELITDQSALLREVAEDYWRLHFYKAGGASVAAAISAGLSTAGLATLLARTTAHPRLRVLPDAAECARLSGELEGRVRRFVGAWTGWRELVRAHFAAPKAQPHWEALELCAGDLSALAEGYAAFDFFAAQKIPAGAPREFFDCCSEIAALRARFAAAVEADFLAWAGAALPLRKAQRNVISFDDLLTRLRDALAGRTGSRLAELVRKRFRAALIDEFQDTDPVQEEIFRVIFSGSENWLYLIGDPKQAIYAFRGADVFSYLDAARRAPNRFRLGTNHRSTRPLVDAVNAIFQRSPRPFVVEGIDFEPVTAALDADEARAPFRFWFPESDESLVASRFEAELPSIVARKIAEMLSVRGLAPADIAVLTAFNRQARAVQAALGTAGIPSVLLSNASVFKSREAAEMRTLLAAIAAPARHGLVRAALATRLFAFDAAGLDALGADERAWETWLLRFQAWNQTWRDTGFIQMFRALLGECAVRPRLLALREGERALTNVLHLSELLHSVACEQRFAATALVKWLGERLCEDVPADERHELRLERDDAAVKVVTVHKSKGLEYNVVICPFAWGRAGLRKGERPLFHDDAATRALTLDLGSEDSAAHEAAAALEKLEEQTRLLYVALTRARQECHFVWACVEKNENSAAMWVLHPGAAELSPAALRAEIAALAESAPEAIAIDPLESDTRVPPVIPGHRRDARVTARVFRGAIDREWRVSSFTSLAEHRDTEQPDYDRGSALVAEAPATGIHAFPAGRTAGVLLHTIFEQLDFARPDAIAPLVERKLGAFGFNAAEWRDPVAECVRRTLRVELAPGLRLEGVTMSARLTEVEFFYSVSRLEPRALSGLLREAGVERLAFDPRRGVLRGFIDLVFEHRGKFFILDWKSNRLGSDSAAYHPAALRQEMARHHYALQYHLYAVALHRYLRLRLGAGYDYTRHFGGVFYVFLRGIEPARPELGVFRELPPRERIERLDTFFDSAL